MAERQVWGHSVVIFGWCSLVIIAIDVLRCRRRNGDDW